LKTTREQVYEILANKVTIALRELKTRADEENVKDATTPAADAK